MLRYKRTSGLLTAVIVSAIAAQIVWSASNLIAPTRSLGGADEEPALISIFSEPPGLEVFLDGEKIGVTPVIQVKVLPGNHNVRVRDNEQSFETQPGQSLKISYFKDAFIVIPEKDTSADPIPPKQETREETKQQRDPTTSKTTDKNYFYWPLNPKGPIY